LIAESTALLIRRQLGFAGSSFRRVRHWARLRAAATRTPRP